MDSTVATFSQMVLMEKFSVASSLCTAQHLFVFLSFSLIKTQYSLLLRINVG